jgi:hypothetical protein
MSRIDRSYTRANDDHDTDQAEHDRGQFWPVQPFAKETDSQNGRPDRRREFDGDQHAERDQRQGVEPRCLTGVVDDVADDMGQGTRGAHRRKAAAHHHQRQKDEETDHRAQFQYLENVELGRRGATGDRHRQKRYDRQRHPECGLWDRGSGCHARYVASRGFHRNR